VICAVVSISLIFFCFGNVSMLCIVVSYPIVWYILYFVIDSEDKYDFYATMAEMTLNTV